MAGMIPADENERLTRTGHGTPMGAVMRHYWQPLALTEELPAARPLTEARVLGEDIVVFRNEAGSYGALARQCAHRAGDLAYGRLEDGGLRCPYHGWLYDIAGRCLEQPAEPAGSRYHDRIHHTAYPCIERNGIVYGYMGPGAPPALPGFDWHDAPAPHIFVFKGLQRANWLQAVEGEIDPSHLSYLHRYLREEIDADASYGFKQFRETAGDTEVSVTRILREVPNPRLEIERTDFGVRVYALRDAGGFTYTRVTNFLFPNTAVVAIGDWSLVQTHVPIDDEHNWRYDIFYAFDDSLDRDGLRRERLKTYCVPGYRPTRNLENRYGFDPDEQRAGTYAGVGFDFNVHDTMILEGQGAVQDRTRENLAYTDMAIIAARKMLAEAMEDGAVLPMTGPDGAARRFDDLVSIDAVTGSEDWRTGWVDKQIARRAASPWAGTIAAPRLAALG